MIGGLGWPELILILVIVMLVFGVGRISKIGSELGKGITAFREGLQEDGKGDEAEVEEQSEENS
ncbi:MAG: twin-arginine translocase TatA/TatE family subunit [Anaerolineales bacterium]|nr:twin-arginine translocase TatA/TatE family subunit [Anaerolineales bacterium]